MAGNESRQAVTGYLQDRFGMPSAVLDEHHLFERKKGWFILRKSEQLENAVHLKISKIGLRAFRKVGRFIKPTTRFIQIFGRLATKSVHQLDMNELKTLVQTGEIPVDLSLETGYVILTLENNNVLGLGFYAHGRIRSQLPGKQIRKDMLE